MLAQAGLPTPGGFCLTAAAYRRQVAALGLERRAARSSVRPICAPQRRLSVEIRLGLYEQPIAPEIAEPLLAAWRGASRRRAGALGGALLRADRGPRRRQFRRPVRKLSRHRRRSRSSSPRCAPAGPRCGPPMRAATWTTTGSIRPTTAMAVLIQPLVDARASGGGLSETAEGNMLISATWGLGSAIAQGEVVPDRIVLSRQGFVRKIRPAARITATPAATAQVAPQAVPKELAREPCLDARAGDRARPHAAQMRGAARDAGRDRMGARRCGLQAPAGAAAARAADARAGRDLAEASQAQRPSGRHRLGLRAAPWWSAASASCRASRRATCWSPGSRGRRSATSCRMSRGVVAELGGSTSHLASLARERGIPAVLGVLDATQTHSRRRAGRGRRRRRHRAVDRMSRKATAHLRDAADRQERGRPPARGRRASRSIPDDSRIMPKPTLIAAVKQMRHPVLPAARQDRPRGDRRQSEAAAHRGAIDLAVQHRRRRGDRARHSGDRGAAGHHRGDRRPDFRADAGGRAAHGGGRPPRARRQISRRAVAPSARCRSSGARPSAWSAAAG